jgi:hypothetical protein
MFALLSFLRPLLKSGTDFLRMLTSAADNALDGMAASGQSPPHLPRPDFRRYAYLPVGLTDTRWRCRGSMPQQDFQPGASHLITGADAACRDAATNVRCNAGSRRGLLFIQVLPGRIKYNARRFFLICTTVQHRHTGTLAHCRGQGPACTAAASRFAGTQRTPKFARGCCGAFLTLGPRGCAGGEASLHGSSCRQAGGPRFPNLPHRCWQIKDVTVQHPSSLRMLSAIALGRW